MSKNGIFFSLKWKIAILIGGVFLIVHSVSSYLVYIDATENFFQERKNIQRRYSTIARALTKDSFLVLDQFAELFSVIEKQEMNNPAMHIIATLDENWQQWQYIWGLENAVFFNQQGIVIQHWGDLISPNSLSVMSVLHNQLPDHQILCQDSCFQFVMIPVMANSEIVGVFGVSRSLADTVIQYNRATASDIAVLVPALRSSNFKWPYKVSVITHSKQNKNLLNFVAEHYAFSEFLNQNKVVVHNDRPYEISVFSVISNVEQGDQPYFLVIDDITRELQLLNTNLQTIWFYGVVSLIFSIALLLFVLLFSLRKVIKLSDALPYLAKHRYDDFRQVLSDKTNSTLGYDELDLLTQTALTLTDQLEGLEKEIKESVGKLIAQGQELKAEKNFVQQLINVAPILIITQDSNGIILSINQAGIDEFAMEEGLIIGSVFDNYIPETEGEHLLQLKKLREQQSSQQLSIDGVLMIKSTHKHYVSWIHTVVEAKSDKNQFVILSLGIDITDRKKIEEHMLSVATHDQLTGMSNRHNFHIEFSKEIAAAKRYGRQLGLLYLDLDQFKIVNDTCGHDVGDKLLKMVSKSLQDNIRETDVLSRIGGDEFTLIMPSVEQQGIEDVAKKINQSLSSIEFKIAERIFKISVSIGVVIYPQHGTDAHELLSNADFAMYQAKASGRGQYHVFSPEHDYHTGLTKRLYWQEIIEDALQNDNFVLCYQPILDVRTNLISHYECLTRIKTGKGKLLMPSEFISYAEELELIGKIDRLVLKKAIEHHIQLKDQEINIKLAVNLSCRSFNDLTLFEDISNLLDQSDVDPGQFIFEISETAAVSNFSAAQDLIYKIKELGCSIALDDFGVGFSSFYYLKHLPVDYVKIDGSFISQLDKNTDDKMIVKALSEVSQSLGKKTVADCVENEATLQILREFGIDYAQGFHIGKPDFMD